MDPQHLKLYDDFNDYLKMMDLKTTLKMKARRISIWTIGLISFKYSKKLQHQQEPSCQVSKTMQSIVAM